jgi:hypothetical protein
MSRARRDEHREVVSSEGQIGVLSGLRAVCRVHGGVWADPRALLVLPQHHPKELGTQAHLRGGAPPCGHRTSAQPPFVKCGENGLWRTLREKWLGRSVVGSVNAGVAAAFQIEATAITKPTHTMSPRLCRQDRQGAELASGVDAMIRRPGT